MTRRSRDEALRRLLRSGDPLPPGERLDDAATRDLRRQILAAAPLFARRRQWRTALAAAAVALAAAGVYLLSPDLPTPTERLAEPGATGVATVDEPRDRQIHLITRGGTRVIWVLKTD